jgi:hypothetical protein
MVVSYRRFGQPNGPHYKGTSSSPLSAGSLKMGLICGTETSVRNNHFTLRKIPEDLTSYLHRGSGTVLCLQ